MTKLTATLCACLAIGLVAGCGGGDDNGDGGQSTGKALTGKNLPTQSAAVTMKDIQFSPKKITLAKGGTVQWINADNVGHDVTGSGFKSGKPGGLKKNARFQHVFKKAGTYKYKCTVHPGMDGTITVK